MENEPIEDLHTTQNESSKQPWQEPKLTFVEPKLTSHGPLESVTKGFFGTFSPGSGEEEASA